METVFALVCGIAAFVLGWVLGRQFAVGLGPATAVLVGLVGGAFCVVVYFVIGGWVDMHWPDLLDAHVVGEHLVIVTMAAPVLGALGALWGFRRARGVRLL